MADERFQERILIVESEPITRDLIARQALQPFDYRVKTVGRASDAILEFAQFLPHVLITNLTLPDLSAKDLLAVLQSQGMDIPVIVIADKDKAMDILQAFRLGATDYLFTPIREAEVVTAVERALKGVRVRQEREALAQKVQQANDELKRRIRQLTTIIALGKAILSAGNLQAVFKRLVEGSVLVTDADLGWLLTRDERHKELFLRAQHNLPQQLDFRLNRPFDDGISSLVALSGEALALHGKPLKRFKVHAAGQSILVMPIKVQDQVAGLLVVMRKKDRPFTKSDHYLLEAVADYAALAMMNARLNQALDRSVPEA